MKNPPNQPLVIISHELPQEWVENLRQEYSVIMGPADTIGFSTELWERLPEAEGLLTLLMDRVDRDVLDHASKLRVISNLAVGVDNIDLAACTDLGIPVGNTPGVLDAATADLTLALLLAIGRRIVEAAEDARAGRWKNWAPAGWLGADFQRSTLGIVGMGKIGSAVAERAAAFGMQILYVNNNRREDVEESLGARQVDLDTLLETSDFVSLHVPLTEETRHLINAATLKKMKSTAILVNVARGPVVDTQALLQALQGGWIAAAALDVTDPEPLPSDHPLYSLANCLIVPHIGSASRDTRAQMAEMAVENLLAGLKGHRLPNCVNPQVYER